MKLQQLVPLEAIYQSDASFISNEKVFRQYAINLGLVADDLIKDKEEIQAEEQMNAQKAVMQQQLEQGGQ
jgi:hypothetical protein